MQLLLKYLKPYKWLVFLSLFLAAMNQCFSLLDPYFAGKLFDQFITHPLTYDVKGKFPRTKSEFMWGTLGMLGILIGVAMVSRIAKAFQDYFSSIVIQKFGAKIFTDGLAHSMKLPFQEFEDQRSGETLSILNKVRSDCEKFISAFINILFGVFIGLTFVIVFAFRIHWSIPFVYIGGAVILSVLISFLSKKIKVVQKSIVQETTALAGSTTESLRNIELVKSLGLTDQEIKRLNKNTFKILGLEIKKVKSLRSLSFIQGTFVNLLRQAIVFILLLLIYDTLITPGEYISLLFYSFFIFGPLQEIGNIILSYREAEASLNNFDKLMQKQPEPMPANPAAIGDIVSLSFNAVTFKHNSATHNAIENISFDANKGETIAFVGPSGSGKSTLMKLLVGLYKPKAGKILYNKLADDVISYEELRKQIGFVTQDTNLFSGTIKENLLFVKPDASDADLNDALLKASCTGLLSRAEKGIDTVLGEGGLKLSGGEKQRISIARALIRKPKLLIFDEATSALDSLTEEEITDTIREISALKEQITILIAHRLSTIMHADKIYVLEQGEVVEIGTHQKLLEEKGLYYAMWRQQIGERRATTKI
jgi:ATP-binding cassette, subfamily B, bacterial